LDTLHLLSMRSLEGSGLRAKSELHYLVVRQNAENLILHAMIRRSPLEIFLAIDGTPMDNSPSPRSPLESFLASDHPSSRIVGKAGPATEDIRLAVGKVMPSSGSLPEFP